MTQGKRSGKGKEVTATFEMEYETPTKGAERYSETTEDGEKGHLRTIYFRKELFKELGVNAEDCDVTVVATFKPRS